jgi:hypothetical protein
MEKNMEKDNSNGLMDPIMRDNLRIIIFKEKVSILGLMEEII